MKRKAEEITERKNSTCSIRMDGQPRTDEDTEDEDEGEWEEEEEEEEEDKEGTPIQTDDVQMSDVLAAAGSPSDSSSSDSSQHPGSSPDTPKQEQSPPSLPLVVAGTKAATSLCLDEFDGQPLWQAAERTLTPMFEIADSTVPSSASMSKSNSELSVKNVVDQQRAQLLQLYGGGGIGMQHPKPYLHMPCKSVDDSDQSSWEAFSTTDESSTKGDVASLASFAAVPTATGSSKESSVADFQHNCLTDFNPSVPIKGYTSNWICTSQC